MVVVIFGVAGVGKTTVGKLLAQDLEWKFYDADDFHPPANIEKMRSGVPLSDQDRQPWLRQLRQLTERCLAEKEDAVLACSALKKKYRDELRAGPNVKFVFLRADRGRVAQQLKNRHGHYFDPNLLDAQFADLERPSSSEDILTIDVEGDPSELVAKIAKQLQLRK
jgi:gluconokinase